MKVIYNLGTNNRSLIKTTPITMMYIVLVLKLSLFAQAGGPYILERATIDAGGGTSIGGPYILSGTIGQPDTGQSEGGDYQVFGGFWAGGPLCFVDFEHFARFANQWLYESGAFEADLSGDDDVDFEDLGLFTTEWLYPCPYSWPLK